MQRRLSVLLSASIVLVTGCIATEDADGPFYPAGFADGCSTGQAQRASFAVKQVRDETLFDSEPSYRTGWRAGFAQCSQDHEIDNRPGDLGEWNPL